MDETLPAWFAALPKVTRYVEVDEILRSKHFVQGTHQEGKAFLADTLLLIDGDEHFRRRRLESPLFSRQALAYYERHALRPVIDSAFAELGERAELVALTRTMLYRIAAVTTGIDGVDGEERTRRFIAMVDQLGEASTVQWSRRPYDEVIAEGLAVREQFVELFYGPSLARRRALVDTGGELPRDLITALLLEHEDEDVLLREATLYLIAATRTTMHAVPHAFHHLHHWNGGPVDLRAVAAEALRLHPPSPALVRTATRDVALSTGRRIAEGERVGLLFGPANRDPEVFGADADEFNPRRTAPEAVKPWGLSFGGGEHLCIGRSLVTGSAGETDGTLVTILRALTEADARPDPDAEPELLTTSLYAAYASYPIVMERRAAPAPATAPTGA